MTFEEAVAFKKINPETIKYSDIEYILMVVPQNKNYFKRFFENYLNYKCTDETAIDFCSDGNYEVYGLLNDRGVFFHSKKIS